MIRLTSSVTFPVKRYVLHKIKTGITRQLLLPLSNNLFCCCISCHGRLTIAYRTLTYHPTLVKPRPKITKIRTTTPILAYDPQQDKTPSSCQTSGPDGPTNPTNGARNKSSRNVEKIPKRTHDRKPKRPKVNKTTTQAQNPQKTKTKKQTYPLPFKSSNTLKSLSK